MSGIFPNIGVPSDQTQNTIDVETENCEAGELFHATGSCKPRFDPASANAVISEILNLSVINGEPYDCSRLDNLATAVASLVASVVSNDPTLGGEEPETGVAPSQSAVQNYIDNLASVPQESSYTENGYVRIGAFYIQWGTHTNLVNVETVLFPLEFPNACLSVVASTHTGGNDANVSASSFTTTGFELTAYAAERQCSWIAVGH